MKRIIYTLVSAFSISILHAIPVLPPKTDTGSAIGGGLGRGFAQGMQRGADYAFGEQCQRQTEQLKFEQEYSKLLQLLESQKAQAENEWTRGFVEDVAKFDVVEKLKKLGKVTNIQSFAKKHPAVQCMAAHLILNGHYYRAADPSMSELISKCIPKNQVTNSVNFALELLSDAATRQSYTPAKKMLASHYQDKNSQAQILYWLLSAAEDGDSDAMRVLAQQYGLGAGVPRDMAEMIKWIALAEAKGDKQSGQVMQFMVQRSLFSQMSEFSEGLNRATEWKKEHLKLFIHP